MKTRKRILKKTIRTSKKKTTQLKKTSKSPKKKGGMYNIDSIVSVPGSYLEYSDKSSLSQASKNLKNELGNECDGIGADYIGIKPPYKNPKMEVFWKTIPNPNVKKGSNQKCWKLMTLDELRDLDDFNNYTTTFQDENEDIFMEQNTYHEEPLAVLAISLITGQFYDFTIFLHLYMKEVLDDTELLKHIFHYLEKDGKDINLQEDRDGETALIYVAAWNPEERLEIVKLFLNMNADVNKTDKSGETPLLHASRNGHLEIVKALLNKNAVVDMANEYRWTPLLIASQLGHSKIVEALLNKNADVNQAHINGETPLLYATKGPDEERYLKVVKALLSNDNIEVNKTDKNGHTPLFYATNQGYLKIVEALLSNDNVDVNQVDKKGNTPLLVATYHGHLEIVKALLNKNTDVNEANEVGYTPLLTATGRGNLEIVKALLSNDNIEVNKTDKKGYTPLDVAKERGHTEIENLIKYHLNGIQS